MAISNSLIGRYLRKKHNSKHPSGNINLSNKKRNIETVKETHERMKMTKCPREGGGGWKICGAHLGERGNLWGPRWGGR